jgi:uncharacterized protein (DUF1800 family)
MASPSVTPWNLAGAHLVLCRAAYGATPGAAEALLQRGLEYWVEEQLAAPEETPELRERLGRITARIYYAAGPGEQIVEGERPISTLDLAQAERWHLVPTPRFRAAAPEMDRPRVELCLATLMRRAASEAQLRERVVEFWHDHFSIAAQSGDAVRASLPDHDGRIRRHALGNFRALLEAMATSPAMLFYLNNQSSRAGAPNENFARELLELHTLGRDAYAGASRTARGVPRDAAGRALAYVDADVWEVARAFTGWSVANGQVVDPGLTLPRTGDFAYVDAWHDPYQKRPLGLEIEPFGPAMADGRAVLDLLAVHPATARFICRKIVRFFCGDPVPESAVARGVAAFHRHASAPDQIAQVVRAVLLGPEVTSAASQRIRRPSDFILAAARGLGVPFMPKPNLINEMAMAGQAMFGWTSPEGPPLSPAHYLTASVLRRRWIMAQTLARNGWGIGAPSVLPPLAGRPVGEVAAELAALLLGPSGSGVAATIAGVWTEEGKPARPNPAAVAELAGWVLSAPAFQTA